MSTQKNGSIFTFYDCGIDFKINLLIGECGHSRTFLSGELTCYLFNESAICKYLTKIQWWPCQFLSILVDISATSTTHKKCSGSPLHQRTPNYYQSNLFQSKWTHVNMSLNYEEISATLKSTLESQHANSCSFTLWMINNIKATQKSPVTTKSEILISANFYFDIQIVKK